MFKISSTKFISMAVAASMLGLLLAICISQPVTATSPGASWLDGFTYRKSHDISPSAGAGTGYVVGIKVYNGTGTDGVETVAGVEFGKVYVNTTTYDLGEIRFTASDGITILPCWKENYTANASANFWVRISDSLSTVTSTIYVYWGNHLAVDGSSGEATFQFYDHFNNSYWHKDGVIIDAPDSSWHVSEATVLYETGRQILTGGTGPVFKLWYRTQHHTGGTYYGFINYAESENGMDWTSITVLSANADPLGGELAVPYVAHIDNYYYLSCGGWKGGVIGIDLWRSSDGVTGWTKIKSPIYTVGAPGSWNDYLLGNRHMWKEGATWYMTFDGCGTPGKEQWKTGLATSTDGLTWTPYAGNPIIGNASYFCGGVHVQKVGSTYYAWGQATTDPDGLLNVIDRWQSTDLHAWTKAAGNDPVIPRELYIESCEIADPSMVYAKGNIWCYYEAVGPTLGDWNGLSLMRCGLPFDQLVQTQEQQSYDKTLKWHGDLATVSISGSQANITGTAQWTTFESLKNDFDGDLCIRTDGNFEGSPVGASEGSRMGMNNWHWPSVPSDPAVSFQLIALYTGTSNQISVTDGIGTTTKTSNLNGLGAKWDIFWTTDLADFRQNGVAKMNSPLTVYVPVGDNFTLVYDTQGLLDSMILNSTFVRPYIASEPEHDEWGLLETYSSGGSVTITSTPVTTGTVNVSYSYQVVATGEDIIYSLETNATGLTIDADTGLVSGTPTGAGTFYVEVTATNDGGADVQNYTLTVTPSRYAFMDDLMPLLWMLLVLVALMGLVVAARR